MYLDDQYNYDCPSCATKVNQNLSFTEAHKDHKHDRFHTVLEYSDARKISTRVWRLRSLGHDPTQFIREQSTKFRILNDGCALCKVFTNNNCHDPSGHKCPLKCDKPKKEPNSLWDNHFRSCSRNYFHWTFWIRFHNKTSKRWQKYWANKLYQQLLKTPEVL